MILIKGRVSFFYGKVTKNSFLVLGQVATIYGIKETMTLDCIKRLKTSLKLSCN
jgi:hypothetical protein